MSTCKCKTFNFLQMLNKQNKQCSNKNQLSNSCKLEINDKLIKEHIKMHKSNSKNFKNHEQMLTKKLDKILLDIHSSPNKKRIYSLKNLKN